jgi:hypothetical protein
VFVDNCLFAPPVRRSEGAAARATLIGSISGESFRERIDWWEYGSAYSSLIELPGSSGTAKSDGSADLLEGWQHTAGPVHIVRSIGGTGAVLLPSDVSTVKEAEPADFRLKSEALAATWSDTGKAVGAELETSSQPARRSKRTPASPKPTPAKKSPPLNTGGGL